MKKVFMIAVCVAASGFLLAQSPSVQLGLKGGVNIASLNVENGVDFNSRASFYAGGLAHIHLSRHFAVQPEIYYSGQGGKDPYDIVRLGYLNIPLLAQYMGGNGFRLQTGPQLGVLLSAEDEDKADGATRNVKDELRDIDFSWSFGAGYKFPDCGLGIDARYNLGLNNIRDGGSTEIQNRVFSLGLFYQFMNAGRKH